MKIFAVLLNQRQITTEREATDQIFVWQCIIKRRTNQIYRQGFFAKFIFRKIFCKENSTQRRTYQNIFILDKRQVSLKKYLPISVLRKILQGHSGRNYLKPFT